MKIRNYFSCVCATFIAALSLVGCSDYDNGYTEQQISFIKNFKEIYGEVDPTQDWNLAERANVTVTTTKPSQVKIYAKANDAYKLVGDYKDVVGTRTLGFDVIEGTTEIMVSNGTNAAFTTVGESVSLGGTRTVIGAGRDDGNNIVGVSVDAEYTKASYDYVTAVMNIIPEDESIKVEEGQPRNNLNKVTQDFYFVSQGPFKFYPIFWNTSSKNTLGVYWRDDNGDYHLQKVYISKEGEELAEYKIDEEGNDIYDASGVNTGNASMLSGTIAAKGITLDIPEGTEFGFYIDVEDGGEYKHTVYSQSDMNRIFSIVSADGRPQKRDSQKQTGWDGTNMAGTNDFGATFTTTVNGEKRKFFCFEDWDYNGPDLNDMVFLFGTENVPVTVDNDAPKWIISAEDLGNTLDIDYNDVVMEIEYVSGQNEAYVTPLAAGGTLASFVYFNEEPIGEIHKLMGDKTTTISGQYETINVKSRKPTEEGEQIVVEVGPDFKVSLSKEITNNDLEEVSQMGGFQIRVIDFGMAATEENAKYHGQLIQNLGIESGDNTPFVICTPKIWTRDDTNVKGHYRWPMESVPMLPTDGYGTPAYNTEGHEFSEWVKNKDNCKDWYRYPNLDVTCAPSLPIEFDETTSVRKLNPEFTLTSEEELVLEAGKTYNVSDKIIYTVNREFFSDATNVTITSDNEDVVKIIDGWSPQIDAVGAGEATLTLHLEETNHYYEAYLTVKITVERTDGGTFKLKEFDQWNNSTAVENYSVILLPNGTHEIALDGNNSPGLNIGVTYRSSNSSVATVSDNGTITAQSDGEAVITVTSGITPVYNSKTATVNVKVPDIGAYGKSFSKIGALDDFSASISTEELPQSGTVIVTYLIQKGGWGEINELKIQGLPEGNYYDAKDFTNKSELKQLLDDNDTYYVVSIEISSAEYTNYPYLNLGNLNGHSVIDAYWKQK